MATISLTTDEHRILRDRVALLAHQASADERLTLGRILEKLQYAETGGTFDPYLALRVLERVSASADSFNKSIDEPEMLLHVERLSALGLFSLQSANSDRSTLTASRGLTPAGEQWLQLLRSWDVSSQFLHR